MIVPPFLTMGKAPVQIHVTLSEQTLAGTGGAPPAKADSGALIPRSMVRRWWHDSRVSAYVLSLGGKALRVVHAQRTLTVHSLDSVASIDLGAKKASVLTHSDAVREGKIDVQAASAAERAAIKDRLFDDYLPLVELPIAESNALLEEQKDFAAAIRLGRHPVVSGEDGMRAIGVAERILAQLALHRWDGSATGRIGPHHQEARPILPGPHWHLSHAPTRRRLAG